MNNKICCLLDTCALSFLLEKESELNKSEKEWYNSFELIKNKIDVFVISSLVMHELSLNINIQESKGNKDSNLVLKKIFNFFKYFFGIDKVEIMDLNEDSITEYRNLYKNTSFLIECQCDNKKDVCKSKKYKHKIDALIVAQASAYANNIYNNDKKLSVATDIGHMENNIIKKLEGSNFLLLESNYEPSILKYSRYPYYLKQRIAGPNGHLSNQEASDTIIKLISSGVNNIMLGHLSKENNFPELAYKTVMEEIINNKINKELSLCVASRLKPSNVINL